MGQACVIKGKQEIYIKYCSEHLRYRDHLENKGVDRRRLLKLILQNTLVHKTYCLPDSW
jgi:hypothetical protein